MKRQEACSTRWPHPSGAFLLAIPSPVWPCWPAARTHSLPTSRCLNTDSPLNRWSIRSTSRLALFVSGVAVAIGFKTNLFNIGVEGQYRLAAIIAAAVGAGVPGPGLVKIIAAMVSAMVVGALYASIAGLLKAYRNVNEVIATIMLNGVMTGLIAIFLKWGFIATLRESAVPHEAATRVGMVPNTQHWQFNTVAVGLGRHRPRRWLSLPRQQIDIWLRTSCLRPEPWRGPCRWR